MFIEGFPISNINADLTVTHDDGARCHIFATQSTDFHRCRDRKEAQIRSSTPLVRGDKSYYYELLLKGLGVAVLRRYQGSQGAAGREQVAFALTHEAIAKLAGDLADCA